MCLHYCISFDKIAGNEFAVRFQMSDCNTSFTIAIFLHVTDIFGISMYHRSKTTDPGRLGSKLSLHWKWSLAFFCQRSLSLRGSSGKRKLRLISNGGLVWIPNVPDLRTPGYASTEGYWRGTFSGWPNKNKATLILEASVINSVTLLPSLRFRFGPLCAPWDYLLS